MTPARLPGSAPGPRRLFVIEALPAADSLLRILEPFALQQARLTAVAMEQAHDALNVRIEAEDLCDQRAERLRRRLQVLPTVRSVALGWRS
ncbi:hypothetical protein ACO2Q3_16935 [Caulobacter sp. KR2-114]|uniref:hypothetical protein n=1 Tax=Caulobacter sp. KR2-114 TaxID=3400912 RepID=UPI003BFF01A3